MSEVGKPIKKITIKPKEIPVPAKEPLPTPVEEPVKEPVGRSHLSFARFEYI